jgi:hypothetical protein
MLVRSFSALIKVIGLSLVPATLRFLASMEQSGKRPPDRSALRWLDASVILESLVRVRWLLLDAVSDLNEACIALGRGERGMARS